MPKIVLAKSLGFCSGVRRAISIAEETLSRRSGPVYSLGSIIHNPQEIQRLSSRGLVCISSMDQVPPKSVLILPSHGTPHSLIEAAKKKKLTLIDVMCPYVRSVHTICKKLHAASFDVVIIGDRAHPEVKALLDLAPGATLIEQSSDIEADRFSRRKIGIISQTTQSHRKFFDLVARILKKNPRLIEAQVFNTICLDTAERQKEVIRLAEAVDTLVVIGSRTSANTKRLLHLGRSVNPRTFLFEKATARLKKATASSRSVGVISGASAPQWLVNDIVAAIKNKS